MARARELILKHWLPVLHRGEIATVLRWLDALPEEMKADDPSLALANCWALFISGKSSAMKPHLEWANDAYERLVDEGVLRGVEQDFVAAQLAMMRSVVARDRGEHALSLAYAEDAARLVPPETLDGIGTGWNMIAAARAGAGDFDGAIEAYKRGITLAYAEGNLVGAYLCTYGQAMYMLIQGQLNEAERLCHSTINRAVSEDHGDFPAAGSPYIAMARVKMERYRLEEAGEYLNTGLRIARPGGFSEAVRIGRYLQVNLAAAHGDLDSAIDIIQDTAQIVNAMDEPYLTGELNREWVWLYIKAGELDAAREKLQILDEMIAVTQHANLLLWRGWLLPHLLYAEERYEDALRVLDESISRAQVGHSNGELIRLQALQALALDARGDRVSAQAALREALELGAPGSYIWLWLSAGPGIGPLLRDLKDDRNTSRASHTYLDSLLDACQTAFGESEETQQGALAELLTPRELEIMRLICKGYSNPEIASELVVTINTIKKHTSNIYGKLGVRSRTQAIARAQELHLV
jgi:LuxR family maltose regulon positive regulatory protein